MRRKEESGKSRHDFCVGLNILKMVLVLLFIFTTRWQQYEEFLRDLFWMNLAKYSQYAFFTACIYLKQVYVTDINFLL